VSHTALDALHFGPVDSETEQDLGSTFVRTADFDAFVDQRHDLVRGPKGSGKSAMFHLFARHEEKAVQLTGGRLDHVLVHTATGLRDVRELSSDDIAALDQSGINAERVWIAYLADKAAAGVADSDLRPRGDLKRYIRATGLRTDRRLLPILKRGFRAALGDTIPVVHRVQAFGTGLDVSGTSEPFKPRAILKAVNDELVKNGLRLWLLFDNLDELFSREPTKRSEVVSALFTVCNQLRGSFPAIEPKLFIRSDIWSGLEFTNKSHWVGKDLDLAWNEHQLLALLLKRAASRDEVLQVLKNRVPALDGPDAVDELSQQDRLLARDCIFERELSANKWPTFRWMLDRAGDGRFGPLPREMITFGNLARDRQRAGNFETNNAFISDSAVREAYPALSRIRCETFLAEFPELAAHFKRFAGRTTPRFHRADLERMMSGLQPHGDTMIDTLVEVGVIEPVGTDARLATHFDVPLLYRPGLGLRLRGRR
jgi:hypothetical protein